MPKNMIVKPEEFLAAKDIELGTIPVMKYKKTLNDELKAGNLTKEDAIEIYSQMRWIRLFETSVGDIKMKAEWNGMHYSYNGAAHMCIGQEAAVVGLYYHLSKDDFLFGTHRNHGEVISKGLSAINKMSDDELTKIMQDYQGGTILKAVKNYAGFDSLPVKKQAIFYFIYGVEAELFVKETGVNKGMSGSMHLFFTPFGIYPNNAVVGASGSLAFGTALYKLINQKPGISISNVGDGGISTGPVWETLNFAAMDQYKELWSAPYNKRPPYMVNVMNNAYGMGGQTIGETMGNKGTARMGAGINPEACHAEVVNGQNVLAVIDLIKRKYDLAINGDGPIMNEIRTYRISGHSSADVESYRSPEEIEAWKHLDPIPMFVKEMKEADIINDEEIEKIDNSILSMFTEIFKLAIDDEISPVLGFEKDENYLEKYMYSNSKFEVHTDKKPEVLQEDLSQNKRVKRISRRNRAGYDEEGNLLSPMKSVQIRDAIFEAVLDRYYKEPSLISFSEEIRDWGGAYGVYQGLTEALPYHRFFNSPIAEAAIVGTATGYAMAGGQAIVELMYFDFLFRAGDELSSQLSKWIAMSGGELKLPVVVRTNIGNSYGVQHSQDYTSVIASITGINMVLPATPYDAKGLMNTALSSNDPTFFVETQRIYDMNERFVKDGVPKEYYEIELGKGAKRTEGKDITIVTLGYALYEGMKAYEELKKFGIEAEVIDMRTAVPFDYEIILESVKKTGRAIYMNNGFERSNFMKHVSQVVVEQAFDSFKASPVVIGARNWVVPGAGFDKWIYPQAEDVLSAIHYKIMEIPGYTPTRNHSKEEQLRRNKLGV